MGEEPVDGGTRITHARTENGDVRVSFDELALTLREAEAGSNDWRLVRVEIEGNHEGLLPSSLNDIPYATATKRAKGVARHYYGRTPSPFASVSEPPTAWLSDRRGRATRTEFDHAKLALAISVKSPGARRDLSRIWAAKYDTKTSLWSNRLSMLRREGYLVEGGFELAERSLRILYGPDWSDDLQRESIGDVVLDRALNGLSPLELSRQRANGMDADGVVAKAQRDADALFPNGWSEGLE